MIALSVSVGLLLLAMPLMLGVGMGVVMTSDMCSGLPGLPICDAGTQQFAGFLPVAGLGAGLVIAVLGGMRAIRRDRGPAPWLVLSFVVPVVAVLVAVNIASTEPGEAESTTAAAVRPAPVPASADTRRWVWKPAELMDIEEVVPGGAGVIVGVPNGVVALDGVTGQERWHYRAAGEARGGLVASPNGELVAFGLRGSAQSHAVVLDAMTGTVLNDLDEGIGPWSAMTDHTVTYGDDDEVSAFVAETGHAWDFTVPEGCALLFDTPNPAPSSSVAVVGFACGDDGDPRTNPVANPLPVAVTFVGLDDRSGAERWRHTCEQARDASLALLPDGTVQLRCDQFTALVEPATGTPRQVTQPIYVEDDRIQAPGARVAVDEDEVVGFA